MRKNEPLAIKRRIGLIPFFDNAGQLLPGQTFLTGLGEVLVSLDGGPLVAAATNAVTVGSGYYYYPASQAETNVDSVLGVVLRKATYGDVAFNQEIEDPTQTIAANVTQWLGAPPSSTIVNAILDELLTSHATVGSVGDAIAIAAGLLQGNFYMDQTNNTDPNGQTFARMRIFRTNTATAAATDGGIGQGEFAIFTVTTTYVGPNKIATHRVVRA